jgi:hypothetical protein
MNVGWMGNCPCNYAYKCPYITQTGNFRAPIAMMHDTVDIYLYMPVATAEIRKYTGVVTARRNGQAESWKSCNGIIIPVFNKLMYKPRRREGVEVQLQVFLISPPYRWNCQIHVMATLPQGDQLREPQRRCGCCGYLPELGIDPRLPAIKPIAQSLYRPTNG